MRRAPADALRALAGMAIAASPPRLSTHPSRFLAVLRPPSRSSLTSNPHSAAAQPGPNFPRLRALALFGRLTAERAKSLVIASVQKPAQKEAACALAIWFPISHFGPCARQQHHPCPPRNCDRGRGAVCGV